MDDLLPVLESVSSDITYETGKYDLLQGIGFCVL